MEEIGHDFMKAVQHNGTERHGFDGNKPRKQIEEIKRKIAQEQWSENQEVRRARKYLRGAAQIWNDRQMVGTDT